MKASLEWFAGSGAEFRALSGRTGAAHLKSYTARFTEWGRGAPLVLVPGLAGGFELLEPLTRVLAQHHRVIAIQLRGEDDPFALRQTFGLDDLVSDVREFLDWRGLERPAMLGVSFGGVIALELAARYPHRLGALAVQGVGVRFERGLLQRVAGMVLSRYPLPANSPFVNQFFNLLFGTRQKPGPLFEFVTRQCWQTDQSIMSHRFGMIEPFDATDRLSQIRAPLLALAGERDLLVSPSSLRELASGVARGRAVNLAGCGHLAAVMQPAAIADEIDKFLDSLR